MSKKFKIIALVFLLVIFIPAIIVLTSEKFKRMQEVIECKKTGGEWTIRAGYPDKSELYFCLYKNVDGGKSCKSSDECEGACIVHQIGEEGECTVDNSIYGCYATIESINEGHGIVCWD